MAAAPHMTLSLSRELWNELLSAALPIKLAHGEMDLASLTRGAVKQLGVRKRVVGLLEDQRTPTAIRKVSDRARLVWRKRRSSVLDPLSRVIRIEGTWRVELDDLGTELGYGRQRVEADAYVKGVAEGTVAFLREDMSFPFVLERRLGASVALADIQYDADKQAIIGSLQDLGLYVGDHALLQLLARLGETALEQQLPRVSPVTLLERDRVQEMVGPMGGALKMQMGVEEIDLEIDQHDLKLKIRFGFTRAQLTEQEEHADS